MRVGQDPLDLGVDELRGLLAVQAALLRHRDVEKPRALVAVVVDRPKSVAHPELGHHGAGDIGGALQVVLRTGRNLAQRDLFGRPAAQQHGELAVQIAARHQIAILERQLHRVPERAEAALHDRDLVDRIEPGQDCRDDRVPRLMVGDDLALLRAHHALLLETRDEPIDGRLEVLHPDRRLVAARRQQRRLVHEVGQVRAREAGRPRRHHLEVHVGSDLHVPGMDAQDLFPPLHVRLVDEHLAIESARAQERRVEHLRPVRRAHDDDALP